MPEEKIGQISLAGDVDAAKARFMEAVDAIQPMRMVQRHPLFSVTSSFALGFGAERISHKAPTLALVPVGLQMAQLILKSLLRH